MRWPWRRRGSWFLPEAPDVIGHLVRQGEVALDAVHAFDKWASGDGRAAAQVADLARQEESARRTVVTSLRRAFTTPVEPEDLFELSERLDTVVGQAKDLVREAEVLDVAPDAAMAEMSHFFAGGMRDLVAALPDLARASDAATAAADRAIEQQRGIEHVYRHAMSELLQAADVRHVAARRELYRRCSQLGQAVDHVAHRIWYAVVKEA